MRRRIRLIVFTTALLSTAIAVACSVPVFRYALEHWSPDPYVATVFHRGELSAEQLKLISELQPKGTTGFPTANIVVSTVDLDMETSPGTAQLWQAQQEATLPWLVLQTPTKLGAAQTVWSGALSVESAARILDSPVRSGITDRLLKGDSVVWVYLESGDASEDDRNFEVLTSNLARLEKTLKLPEIEEQDIGDLSVAPESLKIQFSAVRLSRDDERETALVEMLIRIEPDLREGEYAGQAMAFPIFGRGRALYALVGKGIVPDTIEDACRFLTGACQCTVKAQNPGVDLLMHVDWDQFVVPSEAIDEDLPPLAGFTGFGGAIAEEPGTEVKEASADDSATAVAALDQDSTAPQIPTENVAEEASEATAQNITDEANPEIEDSAQAVAATPAPKSGASTSLSENVLMLLAVLVAVVLFATFFLVPRQTG